MNTSFLVVELAARLNVAAEVLEKDLTRPSLSTVHFPSLILHLGEHCFHCTVEATPLWLWDVQSHFKSQRQPIFKKFLGVAQELREPERKHLVLFLQTPIEPFVIYRARYYDGQGGSLLHKGKDGYGFVVEPFNHWIDERLGAQNNDNE